MAAEIIISAFLPIIREKLISPPIQQLGLAFGTDEKLRKLKTILESVQSVLVDAEERQNAETSIKNWLSNLKDLAYKAEDLLEDFDFEAQRKQRTLNNTRRKLLFYCSFYKPIISRFSLCQRLNDTTEKIEAIADQIHKFNFQLNKVPQISYGRPQTHSYVDKEKIIGREEDKEDIVNLLINHDVSNNKKIMVLPIVAMGGMGKTTLSQLAYRDHRVEDNFRLRIWVCVSDADFDVARLVRLIIEAATKKRCKILNMELLQDQFREIISGKKYLIVLDDVWNENPNHWDRLKTLLDCGGEGSAVVVSTRSTVAAKIMATHTIHDLKQLREEDSWELFRRRAFAEGAEEPANLVKIGKDIIKRCGGHPLAIDTLGSMMRLKNDEDEWKAVLDSEIWKMQAAKDNILPALRLSYNYLPSHLKQCFAFCVIYPKNHEMEKDTLIQLWMANGYIPSDGKGDLEAVGRDIFDELAWRSFFQNVREVRSYDGQYDLYAYRGIITCKMHDLMHDLAQSIMGKECFNFARTPKWEDIPSTARHLLVPSFPKFERPWNQPTLPAVRTIVGQNIHFLKQKLPISHPSILKSLRVLSFPRNPFDKIVSVRHLRLLRWLDLSNSDIIKLPEGICSLYNLQTLKLSFCLKLEKLPDKLTDLVHLRHLYIDGCYKLVRMPRGMGRLKQLQILTMYIVSAEAERGLEQLHGLNLSGELELFGIEKLRNAIDAEKASLSSKLNLRSIKLSWVGAGSLEVFEALKPHDGLRTLEVFGYGGPQLPRWMNVPQQLHNLVEISLFRCRKCKELPPLWQLPFLEFLKLSHLDEVKHIISKIKWSDRELHTTLFPSLKVLRMSNMVNLEDWWEAEGSNDQGVPDRRQFFPCLVDLIIDECKNLTTIPAIHSLKKLILNSCSPNLTNLFSFTSDEELGLPQLQELYVNDSQSLVHLPRWGSLTKLQILSINICDSLVSLPERMESLVDLKIVSCNGLTSLPAGLTKLQRLGIYNCDGLASLPERMESLVDLKILSCDRLTSLPEGLPKLQRLDICNCDGLASLPERKESLVDLDISSCSGLTALPEDLTKLQRLGIYNCDGLASLPERMESLVDLKIVSCDGPTKLPEGLTKLRSLEICGCDGFTSLPERMESLVDLEISRCNGLTALPEGLAKLESIVLNDCDALTSLPEGLTQLKLLTVTNCNRLRSLSDIQSPPGGDS